MKLCFIGNSHLAALRFAWDEFLDADPTLDADFFGARGSKFRRLGVEGRSLVAEDSTLRKQMKEISGGAKAIRVDAYDAFVLVGLGSGLWDLFLIPFSHRTLATVGKAKFDHLVSDSVFDLALTRHFELSAAYHVARTIRRLSLAKPVVLLQTPMPCPGIVDGGQEVEADGELLCERMEPTWRKATAAMASMFKIAVIEQPAHTIERRFFTTPEFGQGSIRLQRTFEEAHDEAEYRHMNGDFGRIMTKLALGLINDISARRADDADPARRSA